MHQPLTIAVLAGTTRAQRESIKAAHYIASHGRALDNVEIIFVDPADFLFPGDGNDPEGKNPRYSEITANADAFFIVTPEYNHSFPGTLKRMLDSELANYTRKPVAIAGASNGNWGGLRAVESLLPTLRKMGFVVMSTDVYFPYVHTMFGDSGDLLDEHKQRYDTNIGNLYSDLIWFADMLKTHRQKM